MQSNKKVYIIYILEILKKYSNYDHLLTQEKIIQLIKQDYNITCDRKTIGNNIKELQNIGYTITSKKGKGVYLEDKILEDSEIRFLIDAVLFSKYISPNYAKDLITKLVSLGGRYFINPVDDIENLDNIHHLKVPYLFDNIDIISKAIKENKYIYFDYNQIGEDKKFHKISYIEIFPHKLVYHNGRYCVIGSCCNFKFFVLHYIDRITNLQIAKKRPIVISDKESFDNKVTNYINNVVMKEYDSKYNITLKIIQNLFDEVVDTFGYGVNIVKKYGNGDLMNSFYEVELTSDFYDIISFLFKHNNTCKIISPQNIVDKFKNKLEYIYNDYKDFNT